MTSMTFGGTWTEDKLVILKRYLDAYTTALKGQSFRLLYADAFAGEGRWQPRQSPESVGASDSDNYRDGSPRIALSIQDKPFDHLVFIEKDPRHYETLKELEEEFSHRSIETINDDANRAMLSFCDALGDFDRAAAFLDPFATEVSWETVQAISETKKIDCCILFPLSAIARQMPIDAEPPEAWAANLDRVFGGRSYWRNPYRRSQQLPLLGDEPSMERPRGSAIISDMYRRRLEEVFSGVASARRTFTNSLNSPMYEFFIASGNPRGASIATNIANHILRNW